MERGQAVVRQIQDRNRLLKESKEFQDFLDAHAKEWDEYSRAQQAQRVGVAGVGRPVVRPAISMDDLGGAAAVNRLRNSSNPEADLSAMIASAERGNDTRRAAALQDFQNEFSFQRGEIAAGIRQNGFENISRSYARAGVGEVGSELQSQKYQQQYMQPLQQVQAASGGEAGGNVKLQKFADGSVGGSVSGSAAAVASRGGFDGVYDNVLQAAKDRLRTDGAKGQEFNKLRQLVADHGTIKSRVKTAEERRTEIQRSYQELQAELLRLNALRGGKDQEGGAQSGTADTDVKSVAGNAINQINKATLPTMRSDNRSEFQGAADAIATNRDTQASSVMKDVANAEKSLQGAKPASRRQENIVTRVRKGLQKANPKNPTAQKFQALLKKYDDLGFVSGGEDNKYGKENKAARKAIEDEMQKLLDAGKAQQSGNAQQSGTAKPAATTRPGSPENLTLDEFRQAVKRGVIGPVDVHKKPREDREIVPTRGTTRDLVNHVDQGLNYGYSTDDIARFVVQTFTGKRAKTDKYTDKEVEDAYNALLDQSKRITGGKTDTRRYNKKRLKAHDKLRSMGYVPDETGDEWTTDGKVFDKRIDDDGNIIDIDENGIPRQSKNYRSGGPTPGDPKTVTGSGSPTGARPASSRPIGTKVKRTPTAPKGSPTNSNKPGARKPSQAQVLADKLGLKRVEEGKNKWVDKNGNLFRFVNGQMIPIKPKSSGGKPKSAGRSSSGTFKGKKISNKALAQRVRDDKKSSKNPFEGKTAKDPSIVAHMEMASRRVTAIRKSMKDTIDMIKKEKNPEIKQRLKKQLAGLDAQLASAYISLERIKALSGLTTSVGGESFEEMRGLFANTEQISKEAAEFHGLEPAVYTAAKTFKQENGYTSLEDMFEDSNRKMKERFANNKNKGAIEGVSDKEQYKNPDDAKTYLTSINDKELEEWETEDDPTDDILAMEFPPGFDSKQADQVMGTPEAPAEKPSDEATASRFGKALRGLGSMVSKLLGISKSKSKSPTTEVKEAATWLEPSDANSKVERLSTGRMLLALAMMERISGEAIEHNLDLNALQSMNEAASHSQEFLQGAAILTEFYNQFVKGEKFKCLPDNDQVTIDSILALAQSDVYPLPLFQDYQLFGEAVLMSAEELGRSVKQYASLLREKAYLSESRKGDCHQLAAIIESDIQKFSGYRGVYLMLEQILIRRSMSAEDNLKYQLAEKQYLHDDHHYYYFAEKIAHCYAATQYRYPVQVPKNPVNRIIQESSRNFESKSFYQALIEVSMEALNEHCGCDEQEKRMIEKGKECSTCGHAPCVCDQLRVKETPEQRRPAPDGMAVHRRPVKTAAEILADTRPEFKRFSLGRRGRK